eukprot:CAMPEP_0196242148 /NCGR_PEP_ID=MMETSP0913-20130531/23961_1 /TAXON_ID=49265 /ORGANISM="Thalassiosira rotula, Strain GSO102" /LENGTH=38 /DNA_ID= /DNA_START= /DNA_END= /DNA_ORIENTATION=
MAAHHLSTSNNTSFGSLEGYDRRAMDDMEYDGYSSEYE